MVRLLLPSVIIWRLLSKIATHLSYKPNFVNYMFREDMIGDGIENCVQYIHNDPEKSNNRLLILLKSSTTLSFVGSRREKATKIKTKIIEKTGYDQVMVVEDGANGKTSDYNTMKDNIHYRTSR